MLRPGRGGRSRTGVDVCARDAQRARSHHRVAGAIRERGLEQLDAPPGPHQLRLDADLPERHGGEELVGDTRKLETIPGDGPLERAHDQGRGRATVLRAVVPRAPREAGRVQDTGSFFVDCLGHAAPTVLRG